VEKPHNEVFQDLYASQKYYSVVQVKKDEMGGACGTCMREERCMQGSGWELCVEATTWKTSA
jgi:hypothetical protein